MPASTVRDLARPWVNRLASYRDHRNDEHLEALIEDALRFTGLHLEDSLSRSEFWSKAPLARRVAVLLFLVDRGIVERRARQGRRVYEPIETAEAWVADQASLASYRLPTLELIAALRDDHARRTRSPRP